MNPIERLRRKRIRARHQRPLPEPTGEEAADIRALREAFAALPEAVPDAEASEAGRQWARNMRRLRELIEREDPRRFLDWDVITDTMFVEAAGFLPDEYRWLRGRADFAQRWEPLLREERAGHPRPSWRYPFTSGNLLHHVYHLGRYEAFAGMQVNDFAAVAEFGGGYGSLARLLRRLGFGGTYAILDLPPFTELQRFYLAQCAREASGRWRGETVLTAEVEAFRAAVMPHVEAGRPVLFVSTWALSEAPLAVRGAVEGVARGCAGWLLAYQHRFGEVDNTAYFAELARERPAERLLHEEIPHLQGNAYLFAKPA